MFLPSGECIGDDLASRNIQRGRDHGLPGYMAFREFCGLPVFYSYSSGRPSSISQEDWMTLASLYESPADIDLFTAGLLEIPIEGALTGPVFNCIHAKQFQVSEHHFFSNECNGIQLNLYQSRMVSGFC